MLSLDEVRRELKAVLEFNIIFFAAGKHYPEEIIGCEVRQLCADRNCLNIWSCLTSDELNWAIRNLSEGGPFRVGRPSFRSESTTKPRHKEIRPPVPANRPTI